MELVSIVVPVYNMGDTIKDCVLSLLNQTYINLEIILVDDGSKDNSYEQCLEIREEDSRVVVVHTKNQGPGPARNEGIYIAKGRYIYFPDADDYVEPNAIERLVEVMKETGSDLVVFGYNNVAISGKLLAQKKYCYSTEEANEIRKNYIEYYKGSGKKTIQGAPWNKFFDMDVIRKYKLMYPALRRHEDECFIARYVDKATRVTFIEDVLYTYHVNDLQRQWDKYPMDYIDAVENLFFERKSNILVWNKYDKKAHDFAFHEYICGFIKALELSFSPKYRLNHKDRFQWVKDKCTNYSFRQVNQPDVFSIYQGTLKWLLNHKLWAVAYNILWLKVLVEKKMR